MYRARTVERMLLDRDRAHRAQVATLLATIAEQNDRLMLLAGRKYAPTPLDTMPVADILDHTDSDGFEESFADPDQLPDSLGYDPY